MQRRPYARLPRHLRFVNHYDIIRKNYQLEQVNGTCQTFTVVVDAQKQIDLIFQFSSRNDDDGLEYIPLKNL